MGTFEYLERKSSAGSSPTPPTSLGLRSSRPLAPTPVPTPEQASPGQQTHSAYGTPLKYSIESIPVFHPARQNNTGIPDTPKAGVESYSGMAMDSESSSNNSQVIHQSLQFTATIQRVDAGSSTKKRLDNQQPFHPAGVPVAHLDARPGKESKAGGPLSEAKRNQPHTNIPEHEEGQAVHLPDITYLGLDKTSQTDALSSHLTYNGTITQKWEEPEKVLGETWPYDLSLTAIKVITKASHYQVTATLKNPIWFRVRKTTGPDGEISISSPESPHITGSNYAAIAADLTPDMNDLKGRPPGHSFWARDLTLRHEKFHAQEDKELGGEATKSVENWLDTQTASSEEEVNSLLKHVPKGVGDLVAEATKWPGLEERAYYDGAPHYLERAGAIKRKGDAGEYPNPRPVSRHLVESKGKTGGSVSHAKGTE